MNVCPIINHTARAKCLNFLAEQKCTTMYYTTVVTLHILEVNLKTRAEFQDIVLGEPIIFAFYLIANPTLSFSKF